METIEEQVGALVRAARKRAGYRSVEALAEVLKVHPNTVAGLERGEHWISPDMLPRLSEALGVPPAAFFPGYGEVLPAVALAVLAKAIEAPKPAAEVSSVLGGAGFAALNPDNRSQLLSLFREMTLDALNSQKRTKADQGKKESDDLKS